jgi:5-methylcytosine-specific restriction endonuclease McrA
MSRARPNGHTSGAWITKARRLAIYLRDGFACQYCGRDLHDAPPRELTLDHLTPRCRGGSHASTNLVTACLACNSRRQDTPWRRYAPEGAVARIIRTIRRRPNLALAKDLLQRRNEHVQAISEGATAVTLAHG